MSAARPTVSVVMPFAGDAPAASAALAALAALRTGPGDERILADNEGTALGTPAADGVVVLDARGEASPAHARNAGARAAGGDWILFLDADCSPPADLLERYFAAPVAAEVGALAGEIVSAPAGPTLAERYGAARAFLSQRAHLAHPHLPRAAAANLLVRRTAFEAVGGFLEGLRAAEDTDFSWRLQRAGWRLELREAAAVEHRYRVTLRELRRQWRGYAAGRAWLARRYPGFSPEPALVRALRRAPASAPRGRLAHKRAQSRRFLALDALLAAEELAGFLLSNRPRGATRGPRPELVLVAERFPAADDPLVELVRSLGAVRVEAEARPERLAPDAGELAIAYREDDGAAARWAALAWLLLRHPLRCVADRVGRAPTAAPLRAIAPAARRLARQDGSTRVHGLGADGAHELARRLARLTGAGHVLHLGRR